MNGYKQAMLINAGFIAALMLPDAVCVYEVTLLCIYIQLPGSQSGTAANQDVMLADLDILLAADNCRMAHARPYARQATLAAAAAYYVLNDPCLPEFRIELSAAHAPSCMGAAVWHGLHTVALVTCTLGAFTSHAYGT